MAKRTNFGFQKHQKELKKQKKREEKLEKKRLKSEAAGEAPPESGDSDEPPSSTSKPGQ